MRAASRRRTDDAPPIGRDAEAARLAHLIDDAAAGAKRAALLLGVPGIGKSTLLRYARARALERGLLSAFVRVPAAAGLPPRFPLGELLDGLAAACARAGLEPPERLRRVVDTLTGATSVDQYEVSLPQIADALEEVGRYGPLGAFVDDYDWAPPEGTELLVAALRVIETPLCFVASARLRGSGEEPPSPLPAPTSDLWIDHLEVRGLAPEAVAALAAEQLGGEVLPSLGDALFSHTLGNPLFVAETLGVWRERGGLVETGGYWGVREEAVQHEAGSLKDMIAARLCGLDEDAFNAAGALAVIGREAGFDEIAGVGRVTPELLVEALSLLVADGFVVGEAYPSPRYRLAHPLYERALLEEMGATRVAALHGRVCDGLRLRSDLGEHIPAATLAHHAVRSLHKPADLRDLLRAAATEAESAGGHEEAAVWYGHLAEEADDPRELVHALTGQAGAAITSDPPRAIHLFTWALDLEGDQVARARLFLGRARAQRVAGLFDPALADLQTALTLADPEDAFNVRHAIAVIHGIQGRADEAEAVLRELAVESAGTPRHYKALGHLSMIAFIRGDLAGAARLQEEALGGSDDPGYAAYLRSNLSWVYVLLGRWDEAHELHETALAAAVSTGNIQEEASLSCTIARLAAWRGDLARAFDAAQRSLRLASRLGNPADLINAYDALAAALLESGMPGEAASKLAPVLALDRPEVEPREFTLTYVVLGEACLRDGDLARARVAVARARHHLVSAPFWRVAVNRLEAEIDLALGDAVTAFGRVRRWLEQPSQVVFEQGRACEVAAAALAAIGDRAGAWARGEDALRIYRRLRTTKRSEALSEWLRERPVRRPGRPRSTLPGHLTERETEALRLVALGRSNQQIAGELFISLGTAKKHVENIMTKAGVSRRTELVPFALSVGVLTADDLQSAGPGVGVGGRARRVVRLDRLEQSEHAGTD